MHLGNSIICPVTGIPMIAAMGAAAFWAFKKAGSEFSKDKILPAIALTALVFALQMINFSIPTTSSSGHIIGAVLLSAILGPYIAFLSISLILLVQCLFFADGGLLALGLNIFNMSFLACFIVYPFIYKVFADKKMPAIGAFLASVAALQLGSIAIALEGFLSGSIVNIAMFTVFMCAIHLAIGIVEGAFTALIAAFAQKFKLSKIFSYTTGAIALILAGVVSKYASSKPDGLEWSLLNMSDGFVAQAQGQIYAISEAIQAKIAVFAGLSSSVANIAGFAVVTVLSALLFAVLAHKKAEI